MRADGTVRGIPHRDEDGHAVTTPDDSGQIHSDFALQQLPSRRRRTPLLVAAAAFGALILMVGTGLGVWLVMRPKAATPATAPSAAGALEVTGVITLKRGQFVWLSQSSPTCEGLQGYADIRPGAQVTVTDAAGKVIAVGSVDVGTAQGITAPDANGLQRATTCVLPFRVTGVPHGVGPYGVEVSHRGVLHYDEAKLGGLELGFS